MANNSQVAHVWANQSKEEMNGSHFYFEGATIYSYGSHFPIAQFVQNANGERAVFFTRDTYGVTTAKHMGLVRRALYGLDLRVFDVPAVQPHARIIRVPETDELERAYTANLELAAESVAKAKRARRYTAMYLGDAQKLLQEANELNAFFSLGKGEATDQTIVNFAAEIEKARKEEAARKREREKVQREQEQANFVAWLHGESAYCPSVYQTDEHGSAYLRVVTMSDIVNRDITWQEVQTSRGANVPFEDARKAFRFVKLCRMTGREFKANGSQVPVGSFAIRWITAEGNVQVGCHFFTWERVSEFAKANGIFDDTATDEALTQTAAH